MNWIFPAYPIPTEEADGKTYLWDAIRQQWVVRQPEEWVRQHLIHFLVREKGISRHLIGVEKAVRYLDTQRRFDLVVYDRQGQPFILCECKAPEVPLSQETLHQAARYNQVLQAPYLLLTNGQALHFFSRDEAGMFRGVEGWMG
jgi:type I site-specific restriction endonuclease